LPSRISTSFSTPNFLSVFVGVDLNPVRIKDSMKTLKEVRRREAGRDPRGHALEGPAVKDMEKGDRYLFVHAPEVHGKLEADRQGSSQAGRTHRGARLPLPNWKPEQTVEFTGVDDMGRERTLTLYL